MFINQPKFEQACHYVRWQISMDTLVHAGSDGKASYPGEGKMKHRRLNNFFQKRQEKLTFERGGRSDQVDWERKW